MLLDCSCGLGSQAITFAEAGYRVTGSDRSGFAVSRAPELARNFGREIAFFQAQWKDLPSKTTQRFDAVFCDGLSWLHTEGEMAAALRGLRGGPTTRRSGPNFPGRFRRLTRSRPPARFGCMVVFGAARIATLAILGRRGELHVALFPKSRR